MPDNAFMMTVTQSPAEHILTHDVYLNHFTPEEAHEEERRRNITMMLLGVALWDVLAYIPTDLKIIREGRCNFVILCFIVSRLMILVHMFGVMLIRTVSFDDYNLTALWFTNVAAFVSIIIASSYLFLRRVLAIYETEKWVRWCFIVSWVTLAIIASIVIPLGGTPTMFPHSKFYMSGELKPWVTLCNWGLLVFDTAVVVAVSLKLGMWFSANAEYSNNNNGNMVPWYSVLTGSHLPRFARAIVRGGQVYYLVTVGVMILAGVVVSLPMIPPVYGDLVASVFIFCSGSMACRVFRNMKLFDFGLMHSLPDINVI